MAIYCHMSGRETRAHNTKRAYTHRCKDDSFANEIRLTLANDLFDHVIAHYPDLLRLLLLCKLIIRNSELGLLVDRERG